MLLVSQTAAAASKVLYVLRISCIFFSLLVILFCLCCIVLSCLTLHRWHDTSFFCFILFICYVVYLCISFFSLPLNCLLCLLHYDVTVCGISVLPWFCDHRASIALGGGIGTHTGRAWCRRVERTVYCGEHAHTRQQRFGNENNKGVFGTVPVFSVPVLISYRRYRRVRYRYWCCTEIAEVSATGMKVCTATGGTGIHVLSNLSKCPVPVLMSNRT